MKYLLAILLLVSIPAFGQQSVQGTPNGYPVAVQGASGGTPIVVTAGTQLCTQTTLAKFQTVGVANSAGTSVTSTTSCIAGVISVNNTSNSAVTFRLQDKTGTPITTRAFLDIPKEEFDKEYLPALSFEQNAERLKAMTDEAGRLGYWDPAKRKAAEGLLTNLTDAYSKGEQALNRAPNAGILTQVEKALPNPNGWLDSFTGANKGGAAELLREAHNYRRMVLLGHTGGRNDINKLEDRMPIQAKAQ